jgi:rubrerythrin
MSEKVKVKAYRTRKKVREAITDEKQGARFYSSLAKKPGLGKAQRGMIKAMAKDERRHLRNNKKIYRQLK